MTPQPERLEAAIRLVIERIETDQIILFGSAARNQMRENSDLDLLVITSPGAGATGDGHQHWQCTTTGDTLDVVVTDRATAERRRRSAGYIHGTALEEGRTIYTRRGSRPLWTGPVYVWNGNEMVRSTTYEPDYAQKWLEQAERKWNTANREQHPVDKCEALQASMERALKALIVAQGQRVEHRHDLKKLWDQAEQAGEKLSAAPDRKELENLTKYGGEWQYPADDIDPETTWKKMAPAGLELLAQARERVPQLVAGTEGRLERTGRNRVLAEGDPAVGVPARSNVKGATATSPERKQ